MNNTEKEDLRVIRTKEAIRKTFEREYRIKHDNNISGAAVIRNPKDKTKRPFLMAGMYQPYRRRVLYF